MLAKAQKTTEESNSANRLNRGAELVAVLGFGSVADLCCKKVHMKASRTLHADPVVIERCPLRLRSPPIPTVRAARKRRDGRAALEKEETLPSNQLLA